MRIKLLPSSFGSDGCATMEQRLTCFLIDDCVAIDAGSLALGLNDHQRSAVRDVIITHPHMDHIATLPIFIDDLFSSLKEPVRVHATEEVARLLERDVFNWAIYSRFSELDNGTTRVMKYVPFRPGEEFGVAHLRLTAIPVNHAVPTVGLIFSDQRTTIALTSDTAATEEFWQWVDRIPHLDALIVEASLPNSLSKLAEVSGHLTPAALGREMEKLNHHNLDIRVVHIKSSYRETIIGELNSLGLPNLTVLEPGREYSW